MRVFDFTLLSGYEFSGVDVAQGFRARLFAKNNVNAKFIFTELPTIRDMELYGSQKIKRGQIMSAHLFMTGRLDMSLSVKKEALLENEKENYEYDYIDENGKVIRLYNSGEKSVEILCNEDGFVINESLFKNEKKYLVNYYTDSLSYTELYNWDNDSNDGLNPERRIFWNKQGQMVYEQCIYKDNVEYLFKNGEVIDNVEFLERFVKALNLCENDICIMDRAGYLDYIQPLFENKGKSKLIAVLHSDHFYKIYEDESSLYMNYEYYYWFKYSEAIDYFVVGTDEHKRSLEAFLKEYDCFVPHIAAIPPGAIPEGKLKSKNNRRRGSIISASRLSPRKGIDILIKSVIKAHELNQIINLDIYGSGDDGYTIYLKNIVKDACADDYIHFKGRCNLEKIYPHYQLFASFSLWETFGLSLMEAVGDGLAMVGLDVRYGKVSVFMVNMVSGMMTMFTGKPLEKLTLPVAIGVAEIAVMIVLETTEKRIAVQRVSINNIYADKNYIAYKLNPVGATPLMFASAAFLLPQFMCNGLHYLFPDNADIQWWMDNMRLTSPLGIVVYMVIICLLTIIFSMVMLSPGRTADDLLKSGDSIQDIYAGKPTKRYLIGTVLSFSVISSIIICICQGGPLFLQFGGYVDASLAMLPCSIMMTTGLWISLYREAEVYRNMDRYHTFI